jgi:CheY-like chemotaxis protein
MFRIRIKEKGLGFSISGIKNIPQYAITDENKLRQILINLLGNAEKFTEKGEISMRMRIEQKNLHITHLVVEIEDTGVGIAREEHEKLFQYFEQTESGKKTKSGTGLGLAISQSYARMMGGDISFVSAPGKGSTFCLSISIQMIDKSKYKDKIKESRVIALDPTQKTPRILIADDQEESRTFLVNLLELIGFDVRQAVNGQEAVEIFNEWHPDLIWMDIRMPVINGLEATWIIKNGELGQKTKIIALTASALEEERQQILAGKCDDYVRKPIQEQEIFDIMAKHLGLLYLYEENPNHDLSDSSEKDQNLIKIGKIPADVREEMNNAIVSLDKDLILQVIEKISQYDPATGSVFKKLAEHLDFGKLLSLLEKDESTGENVNE